MTKTQTNMATNSARDYVEIGAAFLIVIGILFALGQFDLLPTRFGLSDDDELRLGLHYRPSRVRLVLHRRHRRVAGRGCR